MMNVWRLALRGLAFHWRTHLAVALGMAVGVAVMVGAMGTGDCVRQSLRELQTLRLGKTQLALTTQRRFFRAELAQELSGVLEVPTAGLLLERGVAVAGLGEMPRVVSGVQIVGVDDAFWAFSPNKPRFGPVPREQVILNQALAARLGASAGDTILLRVPRPSFLSRDMPLSAESDAVIALHARVQIVAEDREFARFGLEPQQVSPLNAFVSLPWLAEQMGLENRANLILLGTGKKAVTVEGATAALKQVWKLADIGCDLRDLQSMDVFELQSERVFLEPAIVDAVQNSSTDLTGVLTYFVNEMRVGEQSTPYSMVCALGDVKRSTTAILTGRGKQMYTASSIVPVDMKDDQILINQWLADDLGAKAGDKLEMKYFVPGSGRQLIERSATFVIRSVPGVSMDGAAADRTLMPDFPGFSGAESCRDWDVAMPLDMTRVREKDEMYWKHFKGTPKAFVTLAAGRRMWSNRFGEMTSLRIPRFKKFRDRVREALRTDLEPAAVGLQFVAVHDEGKAAAKGSVNFGALLLGLSGFLIVASLILTGLLFHLAMERRSSEWGAMRAMGLSRRLVLKVVAAEYGGVMLAAAAVGVIFGLIETRLILAGLGSVWSGAVGQTLLVMHVKLSTLVFATLLAAVAAAVVMAWTAREIFRRRISLLLHGEIPEFNLIGKSKQDVKIKIPREPTLLGAAVCMVSAMGLAVVNLFRGSQSSSLLFFAAGVLVLIAGLLGCVWVLWRFSRQIPLERFTFEALVLGNAARRRGRSMVMIMALACGIFLLVAVGAHRKDAPSSSRRDSGSGGFLLFAQTTMPVMEDMNQPAGRQKLGIKRGPMESASVVPMRVHEGQDASGLNLNRATQPTLWGLSPALLAERHAFAFSSCVHVDGAGLSSPWLLLDTPVEGDAAIPVIGDEATVVAGLGKSLGDRVTYVDEKGKTFEVRIVGLLADSMLQGVLIMSQSQLEQRYPSISGHHVFLIDGDEKESQAIMQAMQKGLRDWGVTVMPASKRLAEFHAVENASRSIFQTLGAMGMVLGCVGFGAMVVRSRFERRGELSMLHAVGFTRSKVERMIFFEHLLLLGMGLAVGTVAGLVAVLPSVKWMNHWGAMVMMVVGLVMIAGGGVAAINRGASWGMCADHQSSIINQ